MQQHTWSYRRLHRLLRRVDISPELTSPKRIFSELFKQRRLGRLGCQRRSTRRDRSHLGPRDIKGCTCLAGRQVLTFIRHREQEALPLRSRVAAHRP